MAFFSSCRGGSWFGLGNHYVSFIQIESQGLVNQGFFAEGNLPRLFPNCFCTKLSTTCFRAKNLLSLFATDFHDREIPPKGKVRFREILLFQGNLGW